MQSTSNKRKNTYKLDFINIKSLCFLKGHYQEYEKRTTELKKIFSNYISDKELLSRICTELLQLNYKKKQPNKKIGQGSELTFIQKNDQ